MATPLVASDQYIYDGLARVYWSDDTNDIEAVTRQELDDATDLSAEVREVTGWEIDSGIIVDGPWSRFDVQRQGRVSVPQAELLMRADRAGDDIRTLLSRGTEGWILILPSGDVQGQPMNVYPVQVAGRPQSVRMRSLALIRVQFAVTAEPAADVPIPAP